MTCMKSLIRIVDAGSFDEFKEEYGKTLSVAMHV